MLFAHTCILPLQTSLLFTQLTHIVLCLTIKVHSNWLTMAILATVWLGCEVLLAGSTAVLGIDVVYHKLNVAIAVLNIQWWFVHCQYYRVYIKWKWNTNCTSHHILIVKQSVQLSVECHCVWFCECLLPFVWITCVSWVCFITWCISY